MRGKVSGKKPCIRRAIVRPSEYRDFARNDRSIAPAWPRPLPAATRATLEPGFRLLRLALTTRYGRDTLQIRSCLARFRLSWGRDNLLTVRIVVESVHGHRETGYLEPISSWARPPNKLPSTVHLFAMALLQHLGWPHMGTSSSFGMSCIEVSVMRKAGDLLVLAHSLDRPRAGIAFGILL